MNGIEDVHHHMLANAENTLEIEVKDNAALRFVKYTLEPGLHHGLALPDGGPLFQRITTGDQVLMETAGVSGRKDKARFIVRPNQFSTGPYSLMAEVMDEEGRMSERAYHVDLVSDSFPYIVAGVSDQSVVNAGIIHLPVGSQLGLQGYVIDLAGLALVRLLVEDSFGTTQWIRDDVVEAEPQWLLTGLAFEIPEEPGEYILTIFAMNVDGRISQSRARARVSV